MDCKEVEKRLSQTTLAELPPDERAAIEAHLAACVACREAWDPAYQSQLLHEAVKELRGTTSVKDNVMIRIRGETTRPSPPGDEEPPLPEQIGGFEILGTLGRGGMGTVLKARQVSMDRVVALKILPQRLAKDNAFVDRFIREARSAARLRHPHIVQGYDAGLADGYYYFAMEYVDGTGLDAIVARDGPLAPGRALSILKQACSALWAAHEAGIVHRDIKPANIMLDSKGDVRVTDFGLAKLTGVGLAPEGDAPGALAGPALPGARGDVTATTQGQTLGTPAYLAPEVIRGRPAGACSDLYALGATFFHVLAGRPPFEGKNLTEVLFEQVNEAPPPLGSVAPRLDPRLCRIIDRLLRKNPEERYPSAKALLEELEALGPLQSADEAARAEGRAMIQSAATVPLGPGKYLERQAALEALQQRRGGKRRAILIAAGVAVLLGAGILLAAWRPWSPQPQARLAVTPERVSPTAPGLTDTREHNAAAVFRNAEDAFLLMQWETAQKHVKRLDEEFADTKFYKEHLVAIGDLRAKVNAELAQARTPGTPVVEKWPPAALPPELPHQQDVWASMFDGATLNGWRRVERYPIPRKWGTGVGGPVEVQGGRLVLGLGTPLTGVAWTSDFPKTDYEVRLEAMRLTGSECFCSIVFPVGDSHCTLIVGGWGGTLVGLELVDGKQTDANGTGRKFAFANARWYPIRLRVTEARIEAWVEQEKIVDLPTAGHRFGLVEHWTGLRPFGLGSWEVSSALRNIQVCRRADQGQEAPGEWTALFDGKTLAGWRVMKEDDFAQHGKVRVDGGRIVLERGDKRTGIAWAGEFPKVDYEIALEARREAGEDCFCDVYFPIGSALCSLGVGAWGGDMVGLSCVDGLWAPDNGTGRRLPLQAGRWYSVRLRVTQAKVQVWIDDQKVVDLSRAGRTFSPPSEHKNITWFLASWETTAGLRNIRMRRLEGKPDAPPAAWVGAPEPELPGEWTALFDGKTLNGWRVVKKFPHAPEFGGGTGGDVHVENGQIVLEKGRPVSGIAWEGGFPTINYEVAIQACRLGGAYDFGNMDFPVGNQTCTLVVGGSIKRLAWLYAVDGHGFFNAELAPVTEFEPGRWFETRLRVTDGRIQAWVDGKRALDLATAGRGLSSLAHWANEVRPFGIITNLGTRGAVRSVRLRRLGPEPAPLPELPEEPGEWVSLFDGKSLDGWRVADRFDPEKPGDGPIAGGKARVQDGRLLLDEAKPFAGIACTRPVPSLEYELSLEAMRVAGNDCFCLLAFPCGPTGGTLEIGNVRGAGVGLGVVDGGAAAANLTTRNIPIENGRWYAVRLRVRNTGVQVWVDDRKVTELSTAHHKLSLYTAWRPLAPLGLLAAHGTTGAYRNVRVRRLVPEPPALPEKPGETVSLFDGKTLGGWRIVHEGDFARHGQVAVADGQMTLLEGPARSGIAWMGDFPTVDYELSLDLRRNVGADLCEILFPIGSSRCAWGIAGWGGRGTGLGILDGASGDQTDTWKPMACQTGQWYRARLRVTTDRLEGWLDDTKWIDLPTAGRRFEQPFWMPIPEPLAVVTWQSALSIRNVQVQRLEGKPEEPPAGGVAVKEASLAVSAQPGWLDTGLYLQKASPYEVSGTGRWGNAPAFTQAPEGAGDPAADTSFALPGARRFILLGRLGAYGRPFPIGSRRAFTPAVSGRLYLCMNDAANMLDNWGSLRVTVAGPIVADKDAPLFSRFTKPVAQVKLAWPASPVQFPWRLGGAREARPTAWASSGIELQRGDRVLLSAEGTRQAGPPHGLIDADGVDRAWNRHRAGILLGRIGEHGVPFAVGKLHLLGAREAGKLYLAINPIPAEAVRRLQDQGLELEILERRPIPLPQQGNQEPPPDGRDPRLPEGIERDGPIPLAPAGGGRAVRQHLGPEPPPKGEAGPVAGGGPEIRRHEAPDAPPNGKGAVAPNPAPEANEGTLTVTVFAPDGLDPNRKRPGGPAAIDPRPLFTLSGHTNWVVCVGFSPDGSRLVSGGRDGTVKLWDLGTGKCLTTLRGHTDTVETVAYSPDGKQILSASRDRTLRLWDAAGQPITVLRGHADAVQSAAWLPDGKRAVSAGADASVKVWDLATGNCLRTLPCDAPSRFVTVSPDGATIAASNERGWIHLWDPNDGIPRQRFFGRARGGWCLGFSPDGARLALAGDDLVAHVWEAATGQWLKSLDTDGMIRCVAFSPDGKYIAAGGWHRALRLWDAKTYEHVRSLGDHLDEVRGLAFSPDSQLLATASFDGTIKVWTFDPRAAQIPKPEEPPKAEPPKRLERPGGQMELFNGKTLDGWRILEDDWFRGHGLVHADAGRIVLSRGAGRTGIAWTGESPTVDYEIAFEMRCEDAAPRADELLRGLFRLTGRGAGDQGGAECFCELSFPVGSSLCALSVGALGGTVFGMSYLDGRGATENDTTRRVGLQPGQWYQVRVRVTEPSVEAWLGQEKLLDLPRADRRFVPQASAPLGTLTLASAGATSAVRNIQMRRLDAKPDEPPAGAKEVQAADVAVAAQAEWIDTGLWVAEGDEVAASAAGRWGARPDWSCGPGGRPELADRGFPLPGAPKFSLIARVGRHGRPFCIGQELVFAAPQTGRLCLRMNDDGACDNWGSLLVRIQGRMVAGPKALLLSRFGQAALQRQVEARSDWTFSGLELQRGDVALIAATGTWSTGPQDGNTDAGGYDRALSDHRLGALTGRIGPHGQLFTLGTLHLLEAKESGKLFLAINDADRRDNEGSVAVTISTAPGLAPQPRKPDKAPDAEPRLLATLRGHASDVMSVAFSPDGTRLASGSKDRTVRLWACPEPGRRDAATGRCLQTLPGHFDTVNCVVFSPDGKQLASASADRTVRLWDTATGECLKTLGGHLGRVTSIAFFPGGQQIASGGEDGMLKVWGLAAGQCLKTLQGDSASRSVAISPDGSQIASVSDRGWLQVWDAATGRPKLSFFARCPASYSVAFSPDGKRILSVGEDPFVRVWDSATGLCVQTLEGAGGLRSVAMSSDGKWIVSCNWYMTIFLWDAATGELVRTLEGHSAEVRSVAFSPDSRRLASASFDGTIKIWALELPAQPEARPAPPEAEGPPAKPKARPPAPAPAGDDAPPKP
jgi:WD40 repeat protein